MSALLDLLPVTTFPRTAFLLFVLPINDKSGHLVPFDIYCWQKLRWPLCHLHPVMNLSAVSTEANALLCRSHQKIRTFQKKSTLFGVRVESPWTLQQQTFVTSSDFYRHILAFIVPSVYKNDSTEAKNTFCIRVLLLINLRWLWPPLEEEADANWAPRLTWS